MSRRKVQDSPAGKFNSHSVSCKKDTSAQKAQLKKELDRLLQKDVLIKAGKPTSWVLPLVIVGKPKGDLRLYLDPMDLNEYIRRENYHLPNR